MSRYRYLAVFHKRIHAGISSANLARASQRKTIANNSFLNGHRKWWSQIICKYTAAKSPTQTSGKYDSPKICGTCAKSTSAISINTVIVFSSLAYK